MMFGKLQSGRNYIVKNHKLNRAVCICILTAACKELRAWSGGVSVAIEEPIANRNPIVMARLNAREFAEYEQWHERRDL